MEKSIVKDYLYPTLMHPDYSYLFQDQFALRPSGSTTAAVIYLLHTFTQLLQTHEIREQLLQLYISSSSCGVNTSLCWASSVGCQHDTATAHICCWKPCWSAFASECACSFCMAPAAVNQYLLPRGHSTENTPHATAAVDQWNRGQTDRHTHTHRHTHLTALFPGLPGRAGTRKVKPIWILLKQETVSGSGISWAICKSAPRSRQITTPAPHHSVFYRPDALPVAQPTASKHWRQTDRHLSKMKDYSRLLCLNVYTVNWGSRPIKEMVQDRHVVITCHW